MIFMKRNESCVESLILLKIIYQIQNDKEDSRNGIEKSISMICKEEAFLLNRYSRFCFFYAHLSAFRVENLF